MSSEILSTCAKSLQLAALLCGTWLGISACRLEQSSSKAPEEPMRILALGDSFTIGVGVAPAERWPDILAERLERQGYPVDTVEYLAANGWSTGDLWDTLQLAELHAPYDLVTLGIGVNDQFRGFGDHYYAKGFERLLQAAVFLAGDRPYRVLVISIPDYSVTPFAASPDNRAIVEELERFNALNKSRSEAIGVPYLNITTLSRKAGSDSSLLAPDRLHYSARMYSTWADSAMALLQGSWQ